MFEGIKKRWAEARAMEAKKEVEDTLQRWDRMNALDKQLVTSAFEAMMSEIPASLDNIAKAEMSKGIMKAARTAFSTRGDNLMAHTSRVSAFGGALVALYLECQTLPGEQSEMKSTPNGTNVFGMPWLDFSKVALPGVGRELAEQGLARAREGCEKIKAASEEMTGALRET